MMKLQIRWVLKQIFWDNHIHLDITVHILALKILILVFVTQMVFIFVVVLACQKINIWGHGGSIQKIIDD